MKGTLVMGLAALALTASLTACGGSNGSSDAQAAEKKQADLYAIDQIEVKWHQASSTQERRPDDVAVGTRRDVHDRA